MQRPRANYTDDYVEVNMGFVSTAQGALGEEAMNELREKYPDKDVSNYTLNDGDTNPKKAFGDAKVPVHLVPPALMIGAGRAFNEGRKYGPYNWRTKAVDAMTYIGAILRHLLAYLDGEDVDPDSKVGKLHLEGIAACVGILLDTTYAGTLIDNRPPKGAAPEELRKPVPHIEGPK